MPQQLRREREGRSHVVGVRLTTNEFEAIGRRLSTDGVTISGFLRRAVKRELDRGQWRSTAGLTANAEGGSESCGR